jgi:hypothetical protein
LYIYDFLYYTQIIGEIYAPQQDGSGGHQKVLIHQNLHQQTEYFLIIVYAFLLISHPMEKALHCPLAECCTVYINNIRHNEIIGLSYRHLYCLQVNKKYKMCKRYHAFIKLGKPAPRHIMPNSLLSLEEIAAA